MAAVVMWSADHPAPTAAQGLAGTGLFEASSAQSPVSRRDHPERAGALGPHRRATRPVSSSVASKPPKPPGMSRLVADGPAVRDGVLDRGPDVVPVDASWPNQTGSSNSADQNSQTPSSPSVVADRGRRSGRSASDGGARARRQPGARSPYTVPGVLGGHGRVRGRRRARRILVAAPGGRAPAGAAGPQRRFYAPASWKVSVTAPRPPGSGRTSSRVSGRDAEQVLGVAGDQVDPLVLAVAADHQPRLAARPRARRPPSRRRGRRRTSAASPAGPRPSRSSVPPGDAGRVVEALVELLLGQPEVAVPELVVEVPPSGPHGFTTCTCSSPSTSRTSSMM